MKKSISPSEARGTQAAPASKSEMQRAVAAALIANGRTTITNPSFCDDSKAALGIAETLGAAVHVSAGRVIIDGGINPSASVLDCGESGLGVRMFTPIAALTGRQMTLTGRGSLLKRPVSTIEESLSDLGASVKSQNGFLPIEVSSKLKGGSTVIDGSLSSQFLTGLLMALPSAEEDSLIRVNNLQSRQYIDITLKILKHFSVSVENSNYSLFKIRGRQAFVPADIRIEGDWSGAAFLLCAGAIRGRVRVTGLNNLSLQPDRKVVKALRLAGAEITEGDGYVTAAHSALKGFEFDATECPDLFPPLAALAMYCEGTTALRGARRLKHKESDRGTVIKKELGKLNGSIELDGDCMIIKGSRVTGGITNSHGDHRIAMACAIAALGAEAPVVIDNAESINKSYHEFYEHLAALGVNVQ